MITVKQHRPSDGSSPSTLADLTVESVIQGGKAMLNISWEVSIDASIMYLKGTEIATGEGWYNCEYKPHLSEMDKTGPQKKWFHLLVKANPGHYNILASNIPFPPLGRDTSYKTAQIFIPYPTTTVSSTSPQVSAISSATPGRHSTSSLRLAHVAVAILGGLAGLMILTSCYTMYKYCGSRNAKPFGFKSLPQTPVVPVPVLVVYPAENAAFQQAVVALSEFLQQHGGCQVAIDMWQQGKIAALGPMRWLAEQARAAERVLIICPQQPQQPGHSPTDGSFPQPSIPAAAHDLYPLILNMVASHAKSSSHLAKFWVVQLGKQRYSKRCDLAVELRACKSFCLMEDLNKLCRGLHTRRQGNGKMLSSRAQVSYSEKSTVMLKEAVDKTLRHVEPLTNVVSSV